MNIQLINRFQMGRAEVTRNIQADFKWRRRATVLGPNGATGFDLVTAALRAVSADFVVADMSCAKRDDGAQLNRPVLLS